MEYGAVDLLYLGSVSESVRVVLGRTSQALANGDLRTALAQARSAIALARQCGDEVGVAASMVYIGSGLSMVGRLHDAKLVLEESFRMFQREPGWENRLNEAIALVELGKVAERAAALTLTDCIAQYQRAGPLLQDAFSEHKISGDQEGAAAIEILKENVDNRISGLLEHMVSLTEETESGWSASELEDDDFIVEVRRNAENGAERIRLRAGPVADDSCESIQPQEREKGEVNGTVFRAKDESELQAFDRDDHGSVHMRD